MATVLLEEGGYGLTAITRATATKERFKGVFHNNHSSSRTPSQGEREVSGVQQMCPSPRLHHPRGPGLAANRKGKLPTALPRRNPNRNHQPQHGIFLFLFGFVLLGCFKLLYGEICPVTTLAHQEPHVNPSIHRKGRHIF